MHCDYSCTRASILKQHLLTHSGEKQFQCTQYISSFAKSTCQLIQEKSISAVTSATFYAAMLEVSRDICSSSLHVISTVFLQLFKWSEISQIFPHWQETHCLQEMRCLLPKLKQPELSHIFTHWIETLCLK